MLGNRHETGLGNRSSHAESHRFPVVWMNVSANH